MKRCMVNVLRVLLFAGCSKVAIIEAEEITIVYRTFDDENYNESIKSYEICGEYKAEPRRR